MRVVPGNKVSVHLLCAETMPVGPNRDFLPVVLKELLKELEHQSPFLVFRSSRAPSVHNFLAPRIFGN